LSQALGLLDRLMGAEDRVSDLNLK